MKNSTITLILVAIVILVGGGAYFLSQKKDGQAPQANISFNITPTMPDQESPNQQASSTQTTDTSYVEYTKDVLVNTANRRQILFFYASWCPICRPADEDFRANESKIPEDVVVIRVNYNDPETDAEEKALAAQYGVTYQHTFVQIDQQGNTVTKWNGGQTEELLSNIK